MNTVNVPMFLKRMILNDKKEVVYGICLDSTNTKITASFDKRLMSYPPNKNIKPGDAVMQTNNGIKRIFVKETFYV